MNSRQIHPGLVALSVTAFAIGVAEFIVVGILPDIAAALNIELTRAGNLVGLYALALALGSPALVLLLSGLPRKPVLMSLILLFLVGSLISALSNSYALFLTGRVLTAVAHGSFFAIGATIASRLAPAGQAGKAIAVMFAGLTLAMVIGVPLGSLAGHTLGWRFPLFAVSPAVQHGMLTTASRHTPGAIDFASGFNISAFNLGMFFGENVGGLLVKMELMRFTPLAGVVMVLAALLPLAWVTARNR